MKYTSKYDLETIENMIDSLHKTIELIDKQTIEFAEWLKKNTTISTDRKYYIFNGENFITTEELFLIFKKIV